MKNKTKLLQIFVGITCIVIWITSFVFFKDRYNSKKAEYDRRMNTKRAVIKDLDHDFWQLQQSAQSWNSAYATLTLNHTRDTLRHEKYTVAGLISKHRSVRYFLRDNFDEGSYTGAHDPYYDITPNELVNLYPTGDTLHYLLYTYKIKEQLKTYKEALDQAYIDIIYQNKLTDTVEVYGERFSLYFSCLNKIDKMLYELLDKYYPNSLYYLIDPHSGFKAEAQERLIHRQIITNRFKNPKQVTPEILKLKTFMQEKLTTENDTTTVYTIENNESNGLLLIVSTPWLSEDIEREDQEKYIKFLDEGMQQLSIPNIEEYYIYAEGNDFLGSYVIKKGKNVYWEPSIEDTFRYLTPFYNTKYNRYYIKGSFSAYKTMYPKTNIDNKPTKQ